MKKTEYNNRIEKDLIKILMDVTDNNFILNLAKIAWLKINKILLLNCTEQGKELEKDNVIKAFRRTTKKIKKESGLDLPYKELILAIRKKATVEASQKIAYHIKKHEHIMEKINPLDIKIEYIVFFVIQLITVSITEKHENLKGDEFIYNHIWSITATTASCFHDYIAKQILVMFNVICDQVDELENLQDNNNELDKKLAI